MSAVTAQELQPREISPVVAWIEDVQAVTVRNLTRLRRSPDVIGFAVFQPIMFVLLFSQVFGGSVDVPEATTPTI